MTDDRPVISPRVLALLDEVAGRRLRLRYLGNPDVYAELAAVERLALQWRLAERAGSGTATELAVDHPNGGQWVTAREAAELLGVRPVTVRRACAEGRIAATRPGHDWLIPVAEIARYTARRRRNGGEDRPGSGR